MGPVATKGIGEPFDKFGRSVLHDPAPEKEKKENKEGKARRYEPDGTGLVSTWGGESSSKSKAAQEAQPDQEGPLGPKHSEPRKGARTQQHDPQDPTRPTTEPVPENVARVGKQ